MKIDKRTPLPPRKGRNLKYPWDKMSVGDSIFIVGVARSVPITSAQHWAKRNKKKHIFTSRIEKDGIRIWRIK